MTTTCQSEVGKIKSIFVKKATDAFRNEETVDIEWKGLNFLGKPDIATASA